MKTKQILWVGSVAALSLTAGMAQDFSNRTWAPGREPAAGVITRSVALHNSSRASRIVGMRVRNPQNQELGRIEDVVFDLQTGRIAYAVLSLAGTYGSRLVAVPPTALESVADESNTLIMNMDRARLDRLASFSNDHWPEIERPFEGNERFWGMTETADRPDRYNAAASQTYRAESAFDQGASPRYESSAGPERSSALDRVPVERRSSFRGHVVAVSPETRTLSVESNTGEIHDFIIADRPVIQLKNSRNPRIVDIKVGFPVVVGYRDEPDGTSVARTIIRTDTPEVR